jgi:hypothetical protein
MVTNDTTPKRPVLARLEQATFRSVDKWRREQPDIPSRSAAIQRLLEEALEASRQRPAS